MGRHPFLLRGADPRFTRCLKGICHIKKKEEEKSTAVPNEADG